MFSSFTQIRLHTLELLRPPPAHLALKWFRTNKHKRWKKEEPRKDDVNMQTVKGGNVWSGSSYAYILKLWRTFPKN